MRSQGVVVFVVVVVLSRGDGSTSRHTRGVAGVRRLRRMGNGRRCVVSCCVYGVVMMMRVFVWLMPYGCKVCCTRFSKLCGLDVLLLLLICCSLSLRRFYFQAHAWGCGCAEAEHDAEHMKVCDVLLCIWCGYDDERLCVA